MVLTRRKLKKGYQVRCKGSSTLMCVLKCTTNRVAVSLQQEIFDLYESDDWRTETVKTKRFSLGPSRTLQPLEAVYYELCFRGSAKMTLAIYKRWQEQEHFED
jgi:hypothetical protein